MLVNTINFGTERNEIYFIRPLSIEFVYLTPLPIIWLLRSLKKWVTIDHVQVVGIGPQPTRATLVRGYMMAELLGPPTLSLVHI
jgi:hypothetical protein